MRTQPITLPAVAALLVGAALALPACVDGFVGFGPVEEQGEAELPEWMVYEDEASRVYLRETEMRSIQIDIIHGEWVAGIITDREAELAFAPHLVAEHRASLEMLKGPNGPAYTAWLNRQFPSDVTGVDPTTVGDLIRRVESTIERNGGVMIAPRTTIMDRERGGDRGRETSADWDECGDKDIEPQFGEKKAILSNSIARDGYAEIFGGGSQQTTSEAEHHIELTLGSDPHVRREYSWPFSAKAPDVGYSQCQTDAYDYDWSHARKIPWKCRYFCPYASTKHTARSEGGTVTGDDKKGGWDCTLVCAHDREEGPDGVVIPH